jgi:tetratricopeptide (TPR) repeat protein
VPEVSEVPQVPGYRSGALLGVGGFGIVAAGERLTDGTRVALKIARSGVPGATAQLRREAEALRRVGPPAVPSLMGEGTLADGTPFLAMELLRAPSLASRLEERGGRLGGDELATTALALLDALAAVHGAGLAHGDLKPENVLLDGEPPRARLLDLGLATRLDAAGGAPEDAPAGTAEYMAPERCEGRPPDARSDVYACGAMLFEMATGRPPFFGPPGEVQQAHVTLRPPRPNAFAALAAEVEEVILRCLAKPPGERFPSAGTLRAALAPALRQPLQGPVPVPVPRPATAPRSMRRRVGVIFLEAGGDAVSLQAAAASLGGAVAHAEGGRYALAFDPSSGENPVQVALGAARRLFARGLSARLRVDLVPVTVRPRAAGSDRYLSAAFSRRDAWPGPDEPAGVTATSRAADVLPGEPLAPVPGRTDLLSCRATFPHDEEATAVRQGAVPLLGRDEILDEVVSLAEVPAPTVISILGEAGLGKSHLAAVLAGRLRALRPAMEVIEVRARSALEGGDGGVLRALLCAGLELPPGPVPAPPDRGRAFFGLWLPEEVEVGSWAGAALVMGWLDPADPEVGDRAAAPGALASLMIRSVATILRWRAAVRPVLVLLDDAHLAEGAGLDALELAALAEGRAPVFACALGRPSFADSRPSWGARAGVTRALELGPLEPPRAAELCRRLLLPAESVPASAVDHIVSRCQGVPLLLVELVRGLKRAGLVRRNAEGGSHFIATDELDRMPDMPVVEWLAERELRALPPDLGAHAQLAALLGDEVTPEETAGVLDELERAGHGGSFPLDAGAATRRLIALGLLVVHRGGRSGYRLPLLRDALAIATPEALRRSIHAAAFRWYRQTSALAEPVRLRRLARHAAAAGEEAAASEIELALASDLAARHAWLEAEAHYSRALVHLPAAAQGPRLLALRGRGVMRFRLGRYADAVQDLVAAAALARARGDSATEVDCLLDEAEALDFMSDFGRSTARAEEARALAAGAGGGRAARLELARGRALFRSARWGEAAAALKSAVDLAEGEGGAGYETLVGALLLLGTSLPALGRAGEGAAALARAEGLAAARGDLDRLGSVYLNRRNLLVAQGDLAGAVRDQLESVRLGRELGLISTEYMAEYNLAELHYQAGDAAGAEPHLRRGVEIEERYPAVAPLPMSVLLWSRLLAASGDVAEARRRHDEFRARLERSRTRGVDLGPAEAVLADMVDLATREASDAEWQALLDRSARHSVEQEPIEVQEMRGLAALRAGRLEEARAALRAASDLARRIPNLLAPRVGRALERSGG